MSPSKITPMMQQYWTIKDQYGDAILFYRMGDFYEMFFEDAEIASKILEITLTSRNKNDETPIPMCGVPFRAAKGYIARLIGQGLKVAICDQLEDPDVAKGLVKRDVVRVITPGMIIEDELLDEKTDNFVLALAKDHDDVGISYLDISTGVFRLTESKDVSTICEETLRIGPREIIISNMAQQDPSVSRLIDGLSEKAVTVVDEKAFSYHQGREYLLEQFKTRSLEGFGCEHLRAGIRSAGALLYYVRETQKQKIEHLSSLETYRLDTFLLVDETSCRNLELLGNLRTGSRQGSLLNTIDRTITAMGGRLFRRWLRYPLTDVDRIMLRLDAVEAARNNSHTRNAVRDCLKSVYDLERLGSKITMGHCNARDLVALKHSLQALPEIGSFLSQFDTPTMEWDGDIGMFHMLADLLERAIREDAPLTIQEGGLIKVGFSEELDELIAMSRDGKGWLAELEAREKKATGVNSLKVRYNKVFGYYIEAPKTHSDAMPAHYIRKQTLVNAERYITDELKSFESKVLSAEDRRATLEYDIFNRIKGEIVKTNPSIQKVAQFLARIDCLTALAEIADQNDYMRPEINTDGLILIEEGRHPVVEKMIAGERFVPNTIHLDNHENQVLIITGPNMAGKSTVLRQVALLVLMAQMGSFIPAARSSIGITDRIFTRVGALDNLSQGQSTFMVEMEETANILNNSTAKSLVIMDEIGRGTSTYDGMSIAWAVAEYLHDLKGVGVKTLFATHYHELTALSQTKTRVKNFNIAVREWNDQIIFLRKLVAGGTNRSYGIQVARLAGVPDPVILRSKKILSTIEETERGAGNLPLFADSRQDQPAGPVQIDLFRKPEGYMISELKKLDITQMTPLDALNYLSELQEKVRSDSN
ncbi:MAG: DNA mismatch repair protein MutS [Desulfobacterales bacterium]